MKKLHLLLVGAFAALAIVACSDDELGTDTKTGTDTETEEGNTGDENTGDENTGEEEEAPQAYITLSEAELQFARTGGEATVTVDANYDWDCEYESDWFTVVADTNAGTLTVTCDANETGEVREDAVTVTAGDGEENVAEATLTITQSIYEANALVLEYTITSDNTTIQLPLGGMDNLDDIEYSVDCTVDWGDGSEVVEVTGKCPSHTYSDVGAYTVIINGKVELLCSWGINGRGCLTAVKQWGDTGLKSMFAAFYYCANLKSLPEGPGPFSDVTNFYCAFYYCESLTTVPENIFSNCSSATDFNCAFYRCYSLTTAPEDIFSGCSAAEDFGYAFGYCTSLTTIPDNLFADCPSVEIFEGVFYECTSLETVPVGIFDNNKLVTDFSWAFTNCTKLNGESPYTMIDGNNVHLYERENYPEYFTAPTTYSDCFTDSTFSDMDSIPSSWGGNGASPTSITPQSLKATSPESSGPSRLAPQRDAATPQGPAARPLPTRK